MVSFPTPSDFLQAGWGILVNYKLMVIGFRSIGGICYSGSWLQGLIKTCFTQSQGGENVSRVIPRLVVGYK